MHNFNSYIIKSSLVLYYLWHVKIISQSFIYVKLTVGYGSIAVKIKNNFQMIFL